MLIIAKSANRARLLTCAFLMMASFDGAPAAFAAPRPADNIVVHARRISTDFSFKGLKDPVNLERLCNLRMRYRSQILADMYEAKHFFHQGFWAQDLYRLPVEKFCSYNPTFLEVLDKYCRDNRCSVKYEKGIWDFSGKSLRTACYADIPAVWNISTGDDIVSFSFEDRRFAIYELGSYSGLSDQELSFIREANLERYIIPDHTKANLSYTEQNTAGGGKIFIYQDLFPQENELRKCWFVQEKQQLFLLTSLSKRGDQEACSAADKIVESFRVTSEYLQYVRPPGVEVNKSSSLDGLPFAWEARPARKPQPEKMLSFSKVLIGTRMQSNDPLSFLKTFKDVVDYRGDNGAKILPNSLDGLGLAANYGPMFLELLESIARRSKRNIRYESDRWLLERTPVVLPYTLDLPAGWRCRDTGEAVLYTGKDAATMTVLMRGQYSGLSVEKLQEVLDVLTADSARRLGVKSDQLPEPEYIKIDGADAAVYGNLTPDKLVQTRLICLMRKGQAFLFEISMPRGQSGVRAEKDIEKILESFTVKDSVLKSIYANWKN